MESSACNPAAWMAAARRIVFLTGAGISTESGIPDFRSETGLYANRIGPEIFDLHAFLADPTPFYRFARRFLPILEAAQPNAAHRAIARLARMPGKEVSVITQNIDTLHQAAGTPAVLAIHGNIERSHCLRCGTQVPTRSLRSAILRGECPRHPGCGGIFKPDIVFFGEPLPAEVFAAAEAAVRAADLLVVVGTSLTVQPAAGLPLLRSPQCRTLVINRSETWLDPEADCVIRGSAGKHLDPGGV